MGSLEDLFEREETRFKTLRTPTAIRSWLAGKRDASSYTNLANQLAEPFGVRQEAEETKNITELKTLRKSALSMDLDDPKTIRFIEQKIEEERGKRAEFEAEKAEIRRRLSEDAEERRAELRRLKREEPQRAGGFITAETKKAQATTRAFFERFGEEI